MRAPQSFPPSLAPSAGTSPCASPPTLPHPAPPRPATAAPPTLRQSTRACSALEGLRRRSESRRRIAVKDIWPPRRFLAAPLAAPRSAPFMAPAPSAVSGSPSAIGVRVMPDGAAGQAGRRQQRWRWKRARCTQPRCAATAGGTAALLCARAAFRVKFPHQERSPETAGHSPGPRTDQGSSWGRPRWSGCRRSCPPQTCRHKKWSWPAGWVGRRVGASGRPRARRASVPWPAPRACRPAGRSTWRASNAGHSVQAVR